MDDFAVNVRQISQFPDAKAGPTDELVLQQGGLGGPYKSVTPQGLMHALVNSCVTFGAVDAVSSIGFVHGPEIRGDGNTLSAFDANDHPLFCFSAKKAWLPQLELGRPPNKPNEAATAEWVAQNTVLTLNGRTGNVTLELWDFVKAGGAPLWSPQFAGCPTTPDILDFTNATARLANTKFVQDVAAQLNTTLTDQITSINTALTSQIAALDTSTASQFTTISDQLTALSTSTASQFTSVNSNIATLDTQLAALQAQPYVSSFNGRTGAVRFSIEDMVAVGGLTAVSPVMVGSPTAPTISDPFQDNLVLANAAFVQCAIGANIKAMLANQPLVFSFNGRSGEVHLDPWDIRNAQGALLYSPNFFGNPTAPTTFRQSNNDSIATTRWVRRFGSDMQQDLEFTIEQAVSEIAKGPQGDRGPTGPRGLRGEQGDPGPQGPRGQQGLGLDVKGVVTGPEQLPVAGMQLGDIYLVDPSGEGWLYVGDPTVGPPLAPPGWLAMGPVQGIAGPEGPPGPQGNPGPQGQAGPMGPPGANGMDGAIGPGGPIGPIGPPGPQGADGAGISSGTTPPANPGTGDIWFNDSTGELNWYDGSNWVPVVSGGGVSQDDLTTALANYLPLTGGTMTLQAANPGAGIDIRTANMPAGQVWRMTADDMNGFQLQWKTSSSYTALLSLNPLSNSAIFNFANPISVGGGFSPAANPVITANSTGARSGVYVTAVASGTGVDINNVGTGNGLVIRNGATSTNRLVVASDGAMTVGTPTGTAVTGLGNVNVSGNYYVNGVPLATGITQAELTLALASFMPLSGGTLASLTVSPGALTLSGNATNNLDAVPLQQLNSALGAYLPLSGGVLTGALTGQFSNWSGDLKVSRPDQYSFITSESAWAPSFVLNNLTAGGGGSINFNIQGVSKFVLQYDPNNFAVKRYVAGAEVDSPLLVSNSTGLVTVTADPTAALGVATKQYVDNKVPTITSVPSNIVTGVIENFSASYTMTDADNGKIKACTSAGDVTVTCPNNMSRGVYATFVQTAGGRIIFAAGSGATLSNRQSQLKSAGQFAMCSIYVNTNAGGNTATFILGGDTGA